MANIPAGAGVIPAANLSITMGNIYPVGSIYISTVSTNPGTLLGVGTWVAFGAGRVLLGNGGGYVAGATGGAATHTLSVAEMPAHTHSTPIQALSGEGLEPGPPTSVIQGTGVTGSTGGDGAHNNLQPYIVVYMWQRTA